MATAKLHPEPTDKFSLFGGVEVDIWKRESDAGEEVIALIAAIAASGGVMAIMPAPQPDHTRLDDRHGSNSAIATAPNLPPIWVRER
jgi:hypothetical protein